MKFSILNKYSFCFLFLFSSLTPLVYSQTIAPQILPFNKICAGNNFNQFDATFNHSGFAVGTTFDVQLSDNLGSFTNPISTTTLSSTDISSTQKKITFAVPVTLIGSENYKLRVISSTGVTSSNFQVKDPNNSNGTLTYFAAYFKPFEDSYFINNKLPAASICTGGSVTLSIYNPTPNIPNSSPANYPNIKYKWYKGGVVIAGQTTSSYVVNSAGTYYVELDYDSCTDSNSRSNAVSVSVNAGGSSGGVVSSLGNPFCSGSTPTTLSLGSLIGNTYQWSKNNVTINGATNPTFDTTQTGVYSVLVDFGGCSSTYSIDLKDFNLTSSINIPESNIFVDGQTIKVVVTTNALSPTFEWYKDDILISGNNSNTYDVTSVGNYKVKVIQQTGCTIVDEISFVFNSVIDLNVVKIPNLISPNADGINDTWVIPQEYCVGSGASVQIRNANGQVVFSSENYLNNWPEIPIDFTYINPVYYYIIKTTDGTEKKGSITLVK